MSRNNNNSGSGKKNFFDKKPVLWVFSFFVAFIVWGIVSSTQTTVTERTISNVKVQIEADEAFAEETGLSVFGRNDFTVDVKVSGLSYLVNASSFTAENITVTASVASVASAGYYSLPLTATVNSDYSDDIKVESISASTVSVYFDTALTKTFSLTEEIKEGSNYSIAPGFVRENATVNPDKIEISGPAKEIAKITAVNAVAEINSEISSTEKYQAKIVLIGEGIDESMISIPERDNIYIKVPVSKSGTYAAAVEFTNVPAVYRDTGVTYTITPSDVDITVVSGAIEADFNEDGTVSVGTIDFSQIKNQVNYIKIKNDKLGDETETFTVKIDMSSMDMQWREFPVDISDADIPSNVTVDSESVKSVQVVGPSSSIGSITTQDAYAVPDLSDVDLTVPGTYEVPAKIILRTLTDAWIYNTYTVTITVS